MEDIVLPISPYTVACGQNQEEEPQNPRGLVRIISWGECMWGISASCQPYPPQTGTGLQRLSNLKNKAFPWYQCAQYSEMSVLWWLSKQSCIIQMRERDMYPKEAFLTPETGGIVSKNGFTLKPFSQYYFQLQLEMFVSAVFEHCSPVDKTRCLYWWSAF